MNLPFRAKALAEFKAEQEDDLSFPKGAIVTVTAIADEHWYEGTYNGNSGIFPKSFVEAMPMVVPKQPLKDRPIPVAPVAENAPLAKQEKDAIPETVDSEGADEDDSEERTEEAASEIILTPWEAPKKVETNTPPKPKASSAPSVPVPMPSTRRKDDPYAISKQFIGAGKSSYVPPVKPRDQSNVIHGFHDVAKSSEIVRESDPVVEEEEEGPKMSLKDKIAMLEVQQREMDERAAAQEKKEKKKKAKNTLKQQNTASLLESYSHTELSHHGTGNTIAEEHAPVGHEHGVCAGATEHNLDIKEEDEEETEALEETDRLEKEDAEALEEGESEEANDEEEESEEDEEEDEEVVRRRKLVERMAKISGGRNMFGMMGMASPFGTSKTDTKPNRSKSVRKASASDEVDPSVPAHSHPVVPPSAMPLPGLALSLLKPEEENRQPPATTEDGQKGKIPVLNSLASEPENEAGDELTVVSKDSALLQEKLKTSKSETSGKSEVVSLEGENTGYEADVDLSDRGGVPVPTEVVPPLPTWTANQKMPPPPPPSSAPLPPPPSLPPPLPVVPSVETVVPEVPVAPEVPNAPKVPAFPPMSPPIPHAAPPLPTNKKYAPPPVPLPPRVEQTAEAESPATLSSKPCSARGIIEDDEELQPFEAGLDYVELPRQFHPLKAKTFSPQAPMFGSDFAFQRRNSGNDGVKRSGSLGRKSSISLTRSDIDAADRDLEEVKNELKNFDASSSWWTHNRLPESLRGRAGKDLVYEIDTHEITRRGKVTTVFKDYYVLYSDLSQLVIEIQFDKGNPVNSVGLIKVELRPPPPFRQELLQEYSSAVGESILFSAKKLQEFNHSNSVVSDIFTQFKMKCPWILQPVGQKVFGATIYKSVNKQVTVREAIRPGDVVCMKNVWFADADQKQFVIGDDGIYAAVVVNYDEQNDRIRVIENDESGLIQVRDYDFKDIKSGHVRVFRVVKRSYIGWDNIREN